MESIYFILVFIFGTIIGSFLNVVICRYNTGRSIAKGRSCCFSCGKTLQWYELIPLLSYCIQGRKCRSCKTRMSSQYAVVELATGALFVGIAHKLMLFTDPISISEAVFWWVVASVLLVITVYDLRHMIIPDGLAFLFGLLALGKLYSRGADFADFATGFVLGGTFFLIWYLSNGRAMGLGDAKLAVGIGWLFPWVSAVSAIILSFWFGAVMGIVLLLLPRGRFTLKSEIPFAPFLILGVFVVFFTDVVLI